MRVFFWFGLILWATSSTTFGAGSKASGFAEQYENQKWDAARPPVVDEPALHVAKGTAAWEKATKEPSAYCDSKRSLIGREGSRLEAVGVKEKTIEVRGAFLRFKTCLLPEPEQGAAHGNGWIDMSSWDSGLAARDRRVARYVFGVEQEGQVVAPFTFTVEPWRLPPPTLEVGLQPADDTWDATLKAKVDFRGFPIHSEFAVTILRKNGTTRLYSRKDANVHFMNDVVEKGFAEMMALCNHHFLASFALVSFDLNLTSNKTVAKPKKK